MAAPGDCEKAHVYAVETAHGASRYTGDDIREAASALNAAGAGARAAAEHDEWNDGTPCDAEAGRLANIAQLAAGTAAGCVFQITNNGPQCKRKDTAEYVDDDSAPDYRYLLCGKHEAWARLVGLRKIEAAPERDPNEPPLHDNEGITGMFWENLGSSGSGS